MNENFTFLDFTGLHPNSMDTDYLFEVIVASLIEQGCPPDQIEIVRDGIARRGISKDVEAIRKKYSAEELTDYLCVSVNREGLYDMLPEGLFHKPTYKRTYKDIESDVEKAVDEIKIHREQEFFARKFFHLFELMADQTLIDACLYETKYDRKITHKEFVRLFVQYWPVLNMLEHKQAIFFMHIIPIIHTIRTDHEDLAEALSFILDVPVELSYIDMPAKQSEHFFESSLNSSCLGVDLVLGNSFDDGESDLKIRIGPISATRMRDFLETAKGSIILDELCALFFPVNLFITKEFIIDPADSEFILSDENHETYLGINSYL